MKTPIDPSEPMFPVRPTEPVCQYYMKHGTCKFGQACKFHHPPQPPLQAVVNGRSGTVVMNVGSRPADAPHLVLNPVGTDNNGSMMLQFLPQRPDEPDCIYFLKNGRCKYGATCRYHHPINYVQQQQRRVEESSRPRRAPPGQDPYRVQNVQYVVQQVPSAAYLQQNQNQGAPAPDGSGPVTYLNFDSSPLQGFQALPIVSNSDGTTSYAVPITDQGSSASSIASSFETVSNLGRNGSGGSLSAFATAGADSPAQTSRLPTMQQVPVLHNSASDGNIARRNRSTSYGSETSYYDGTVTTASLSRNTSVGSWRNDHSSSLDHSGRRPAAAASHQYQASSTRSDGGMEYSHPQSQMRARVPVSSGAGRGGPRRSSRREGEEGFTMMTSALLNLLDTPEEVGAAYDEGDPRLMYAASDYPPAHTDHIDPAYFEQLSLRETGSGPMPPPQQQYQHHQQHHDGSQGAVDPPWLSNPSGSSSAELPSSRRNDEAMQVMQQHHHNPNGPSSHSSHSANDVGLYLP